MFTTLALGNIAKYIGTLNIWSCSSPEHLDIVTRSRGVCREELPLNFMFSKNVNADAFDETPLKLWTAISGSQYFQARREEEISSTSYFCRVNNKRFNFSTNPTFFTASDGSLTQTSFFKDPQTFITQVGLYNEENELLAVAKLSQPLLNSYAREAIIKVKLDF